MQKRGKRNKLKVFKRGASYAAREKGAKRGSKRDKRDAVTPAAGSGGRGDQVGDPATLRDSGGLACGVAVLCPPNATQRCTAEASKALKAEAGASTRERSLPLAIPEPARVADGRLGRSVAMAKGEAHQAGNLQAACDGDGPLAVPSQLVVQVGFEGSVWRQASTTGGRPESYRAEVQARA